MSERDIPHEINRELFLDPAVDVNDSEAYETLKEFHEKEIERDEEAKKKPEPR